jgi:RNA 3'-terminal phosphate cyclase (ATP)
MIEIDGSQGEGGGQVLRTALALSMVTGQPVTLTNIRAGRTKPGLMRQHLACVQAAARISTAQTQGAELGSRALRFEPGIVQPGHYRFDVGSAGSCLLVLQTVLPPLLLAAQPSHLTLTGGTHNPMAPPFHFIERAFVPLLRRMGADVQLTLRRHGFYPAGGGEIEAVIHPATTGLRPLVLEERGAMREAYAEALAAGIARSVADRELLLVGEALGWAGDHLRAPPLRQNEGPGNALMATLQYAHHAEVFTQFGEKNLSAEQVARRLVNEVRRFERSSAAVGEHLADQLAIPLALARGGSYTASEISLHASTNFEVIQRFLPVAFELTPLSGATRVSLRQRG